MKTLTGNDMAQPHTLHDIRADRASVDQDLAALRRELAALRAATANLTGQLEAAYTSGWEACARQTALLSASQERKESSHLRLVEAGSR